MNVTSDNGKLVTLTDAAQTEVRRLLATDEHAGQGLRLGIKGGGCSGLTYVLDFTEHRDGDQNEMGAIGGSSHHGDGDSPFPFYIVC